MRDAARAGAGDLGEGFGMAENTDSERAMEVLLARLMQREGRRALPAIRIASGTALGGAETWCVAQVLLRERHDVPADLDSIASLTNVPASVLLPAFAQTEDGGYLTGDAVRGWHTTEVARVQWEVFSAELRSWLLDRMGSTTETADADAQLLEAHPASNGRPDPRRGGGFRADSRGPRTGQLRHVPYPWPAARRPAIGAVP